MWANTADRAARMRNAHNFGPACVPWHARRLFGADVDTDALTPTQWKQAEAARLAWLRANSIKGVRAKALKRAKRLRALADAIEAEAAGE
jgi:hypothetical protein